MKKFFAFVAAALVAFSFTACENAGGGGSNFFKISVSNIGSVTVDVEIVPADSTLYYSAAFFLASDLAKRGADSLALDYAEYLNDLAQEFGAQSLIDYKIICQGTLAGTMDGLAPSTDYAAVAFQLEVNGNTVTLGKEVSYKTFKTKDIEIKGEVDLGVLDGGGFEDYRESDGSYVAYATDMDNYDVTLNIYDTDFIGNFTEADLDSEYSYIWTKEMNSEALPIVKAQLESKLAGAGSATISGWVIADNYIKYKFSFTHPTVEAAGAPKKVAAKSANELKPAAMKVIRK